MSWCLSPVTWLQNEQMFHTMNSPAMFSEYGNCHCNKLIERLVLERTHLIIRICTVCLHEIMCIVFTTRVTFLDLCQ